MLVRPFLFLQFLVLFAILCGSRTMSFLSPIKKRMLPLAAAFLVGEKVRRENVGSSGLSFMINMLWNDVQTAEHFTCCSRLHLCVNPATSECGPCTSFGFGSIWQRHVIRTWNAAALVQFCDGFFLLSRHSIVSSSRAVAVTSDCGFCKFEARSEPAGQYSKFLWCFEPAEEKSMHHSGLQSWQNSSMCTAHCCPCDCVL